MGFRVDPKDLKYHFIARPDESKDLVLYKWPDKNIPYMSIVTVQPDEWAFFIKKGRIVGYLEPGEQRMDGASIPFIRDLLDTYTSNKVLLSELYFVSSREFANNKFGGSMGELRDPSTHVMIRCRIYGQFTFRVTEPSSLLLKLMGTRGSFDNEEILGAIRDRLMKVMRATVNTKVVEGNWDILKVTSGAHNTAFEDEVLAQMHDEIGRYGLEVCGLEDFVISVAEEDKPKLQEIWDRRARMRLAKDEHYAEMADAEAILGAAEGLRAAAASAGGGAGGAGGAAGMAQLGLGVGIGMGLGEKLAGRVAGEGGGAPRAGYEPVAAAAFCSQCGQPLEDGDKFCSGCGARLVDA